MPRIEVGENEIWLDGYLINQLRSLKYNVLHNDLDGLVLVTGREGRGKTTLAVQIGAYLDPRFTVDNIVFEPEPFFDLLKNAGPDDKGRCYILDEAYLSFSTSNRFENFQKKLLAILTMIRKKNLFLIVVSPSFFDLAKQIVCRRAECNIYVYGDLVDGTDEHGEKVKVLKKGKWRIYDRRRVTDLWISSYKTWDMNAVKANLYGVFNRHFPVDREEYERRKDAAIKRLEEGLETKKGVRKEDIPKHERQGAIGMLKHLRDWRMLKPGAIAKAQEFLGLSGSYSRELVAAAAPSKDSPPISPPDSILTTSEAGGENAS